MSRLTAAGFTLAELLIALLILGEIATFTIPKILSSSQNAQKNAVFKETIGALSEAMYLFCLSPDASSNPVPYTYITSRMNAVKQCPANSVTQGCFGISTDTENIEPGFIMHNGATLAGFRTTNQPWDGIIVDWNGSAGPNVVGDDQMSMGINFTQASPYFGARRCGAAPHSGSAASVALYQSLYSN